MARPMQFFFKKKWAELKVGRVLVTRPTDLFYYLLLFLLLQVSSGTFFVFLCSPSLGSLYAFLTIFWFWAHMAPVVPLVYLLQGGPVNQWAARFHPELSLLPKSPALFRGFKLVIE